VGDGSTNEAEPGGLYQSDYPGICRRASVPGDPANRPGHHDRRRIRPAAEYAVPGGSGFLVEIATTIHDGTAYVFTSQNPSGSGDQSADRAAFRNFLAGVRLQR
jgi:hypothetical protein